MDSSYISHFRDSTPSFFQHSYLIIYRVIVNSAAKVQSSCEKTDIGGEKMKRED